MLSIGDRADIDLSEDRVDIESKALGDYQFLAYAIIGPSGSHTVSVSLYVVVLRIMGRVI